MLSLLFDQSREQTGDPNNILGKPYVDFSSIYDLGESDPKGTSTDSKICTEKATGIKYSCMCADKKDEEMITNLRAMGVLFRKYVQTWLQLSEGKHPSILLLKGAYEDADNMYLVNELCFGDSLDDWIDANEEPEEDEIAYITCQVVNAVLASHSVGIALRSLDLDNLVFVSEEKGSLLKARPTFDAEFMKEGTLYDSMEFFMEDTSYRRAPEIKKMTYGKEVDMWSAGAILYKLLTGQKVGEDDDLHFLINQIPASRSDAAKDLVKKMLELDPKKRITTAEALEHPWLKPAVVTMPHYDQYMRFKRFHYMLEVLAKTLSEEENQSLKEFLNNMDTFGSIMTLEELKTELSLLASKLSKSTLKELLDVAEDFYSAELVVNIMDRHKFENKNIHKAFMFFDKNGDGFITRDDLGRAMAPYRIQGEAVDEIINDVATDKDGKINDREFKAMIKKEMQGFDEKQRKLQF